MQNNVAEFLDAIQVLSFNDMDIIKFLNLRVTPL